MASVFKRGRWVDADGRKAAKDAPGARWVASRFWTVKVYLNGRPKLFRGYTDKAASEQMGAKLERNKARGKEGLVDLYKAHRSRPLIEHVGDWITELKQLDRDEVYTRLCEARMKRLAQECSWPTLGAIKAEDLIKWRQTAQVEVGHAKKPKHILMGARTQNHYLTTLRTFIRWAIKRHRLAADPVTDLSPVSTAGELRRERRAMTEEDLAALLEVVKPRHQLAYRVILMTGLRRDELRQLQWGDVKLMATQPHIQLRALTTKAKRADTIPLRADLAALLKEARGDAGDDEQVCRAIPSMETHKKYLVAASIPFEDDQGKRADFHSLRHTYGSMLAKAGVAPRVAMSLMRHTDMRLTMNVYTDPRIFDMGGAVEKLTALPDQHDDPAHTTKATGTDGPSTAGRTQSVTYQSAGIGKCSAGIGEGERSPTQAQPLVIGGVWQQKSPSGGDGQNKRVKGVEPSTFTLATKMTRTPKKRILNELRLQLTSLAAPAQRFLGIAPPTMNSKL